MRKVVFALLFVCTLVIGIALTSPTATVRAAPTSATPMAGGYARVANAASQLYNCVTLGTVVDVAPW